MIDIHTHILPCMDDGSSSVKMSLHMLREEKRQHVDQVVLTPHFYAHQNSPQKFLERRQRSWEKLSNSLESGLPELRLGAEVQYFEGICQAEGVRSLCMEGTDILLLEMPFTPWTDRILRDAMDLERSQHLQVLIAHIDRYFSLQHREAVDRLANSGLMIQANSSAFLHFKSRRRIQSLLKNGRICCVASDCHNMTDRRPNLEEIRKYISGYEDSFIKL